jgi:hypothetical protein
MEANMPFAEAGQIRPEEPLPTKFHTDAAVRQFLGWFEDQPFVTSTNIPWLVRPNDWIIVLTALARGFKDVLISLQAEPDADVAAIYQQSPLGIQHVDAFEKTITQILVFVSDPKFSPPSGSPI